MPDHGYLLDNREAAAGVRFQALEAIFNPGTFRHIEALGIAPGWRCWEVGAGGATVVQWLAQRVGPTGRVLATDIDTAWAEAATSAATGAAAGTASNAVEVRRHDVANDPPPEGPFDLVHARLVLVHVPERQEALRRMVQALRPGGWLVLEDADPALQPLSCLEVTGPAQALANKLRSGFRALMADRGVELAYGRTLPRILREAGLRDVAADAYFPVALPECATLELGTIQLIREQLLGAGIATAAEIEAHLANVAAGTLDLTQPPMITAWGRKA